MNRSLARWWVGAAILLLTSATPASAELRDCTDRGGKKWAMLQDAVRWAAGSDSTPALHAFMKRVKSRLKTNLDAVATEVQLGSHRPSNVNCGVRFPTSRDEFKQARPILKQDEVLLEIWAVVDSIEDDGAGEPAFRASLEVAVVPLDNQFVGMPNGDGFFTSSWKVRPHATTLPSSCDASSHLKSKALASLGVYQYTLGNFDQAYSLFNRSRCLIVRAGPSADTGWIDWLLEETLRKARSSGRPSVLANVASDTARSCPP